MLPRVDTMTQLNLFKYYKASLSSPQVSPDEVPSTAISAVNNEVEEVMASSSITKNLVCDWQVIALSPHT